MSKVIATLFSAMIIISACGSNATDGGKRETVAFMEALPEDSNDVPAPPLPGEASVNSDRDITVMPDLDKKKIIKDGSISITVKDLDKAKSWVDTLVSKYNAYYGSENLYSNNFSKSYRLTIRIQSLQFEKFISEIEAGDGDITGKYINARDVTTEFIDLETRLANKRSYLERYRELLKQAKTVKEILEIDEQIRTIVEEIDSAEGRLKYLKDQVDYSTLDITLVKNTGYGIDNDIRGPFGVRLKRAISGGWNGLVTMTLIIIRLWPLWIVCAIVIPVWVKARKKRKS